MSRHRKVVGCGLAKYARAQKPRKFKSRDVPNAQLFREIDEAFNRFFLKRGIVPHVANFLHS